MGECKGQPLSEELDIRGPSVGPVPSHLFPVFCGERPSDLLLSLFILSYLCRLTCLLRFSSPLFIKIDQDPSLTTIFFFLPRVSLYCFTDSTVVLPDSVTWPYKLS